MADNRNSLRETHKPNPVLQSLFHALDPISVILSLNSIPSHPIPLRLTIESYTMERGPRYRAYAELRETRLRMKSVKQQEREDTQIKATPKMKQVQSSSKLEISRKGSSVLPQSVSDIAATLNKENRETPTSGGIELIPQGKNSSNSKGSKSANAVEKKGRSTMARKSSESIEELKKISFSAANATNGENRGGKRSGRGLGGNNKTVMEGRHS